MLPQMAQQQAQSLGTPSVTNPVPQDASQLDKGVVKVMSALKKIESGGDYNAVGDLDKGVSRGAYQFNKDNFKNWASEYQLDPNDFSPANQNKVAYARIKKFKDEGRSPEEIAALWNGAKKTPDGKYTYINPRYGERFRAALGAPQGQSPTPQQPQMVSRETPQEQPKDDKSFARKAAEFAFPILEKKERTPLETIGDIGLSALWFVPGVGVGASAGLRALGVGAKAAKGLAAVGTGAATGYAADVSQKLSEGKTGGEAFTPGLGTVLGAGTAGIASRVAGKYSQKGILEGFAKENNSVFGQTKRGANELAESFSKKKDPGNFLAERGINLKRLVDPETVAYTTKDTAQKIFQDSSSLNEVLTNSLARVQGSKPVQELEEALLAKVPKNHPERADLVRREMQLLKQQYGDAPSAADLNEWKQRAWGLGKFDMAVPSDTRLTYRMIGNHLKTEVENLADKAGLKRVGEFNELIGSHLDAADMLEMLHGTKAKGGRLGNLITQQTLMTVGGIGGFAGAGPIGAIGGLIVTHYGAKALGALIRKVEGAPIKSAILNRIEKEEPEIVRQFQEFAQKTPQALQQLKQQLSEKGIDIFEEAATKAPKVMQLAPKESKPGLMQQLMTTAGARVGAQ